MKRRFIDTAITAALKAGSYAKKRKGRIRKISYKGEINLVTDVDKTCEDIIVSAIQKNFPCHGILSEEGYGSLSHAEYRWIIDPLDGTTNYSRALPIYCVSIALEFRGKIIAGVVYDPEREELFRAEAGRGAFLNKKRIFVSNTRSLKDGFFVTGFAYDVKTSKFDNIDYFRKFIKRSLAVRRLGAAALDLSYVACGRFDGFWEMNLHPWDSAAGMLIVQEAGGKVTKFDNAAYSCYDREILATNANIHKKMIDIMKR